MTAVQQVIHSTHVPEGEKRFFPDCRYCKRCCRLVWGERVGVTSTGAKACPGPTPVELREVTT